MLTMNINRLVIKFDPRGQIKGNLRNDRQTYQIFEKDKLSHYTIFQKVISAHRT